MEGIVEAGGLAVLLPITTDERVLIEYLDKCSGFLISGGPDIDAVHFREPNLPFGGEISPYRDYMELFIVKKAVELNKPVFGICRGVQVINVAMGGTIYQDIHFQLKGTDIIKHSQEAPKWYPTHDIYIEKNSNVNTALGTERIRVNSFHHQAVKDVAPGFTVTSRASDGIIESIEALNHPFIVGVQWHPELMWQKNRVFLNLFSSFIKAAATSDKII